MHSGKIAIFIDGQNLSATCHALGLEMDFRRLLQVFSGKGQLVRASLYTTVFGDHEDNPVKPLMDWLQYNGYRVVTKTVHETTDASGRRKARGSMHVELACDVMDMAGTLDGIYLFSGDGDYRALVAAVQRRGVRVSVVSSLKTPTPMAADALRRQADEFIELDSLADRLARTDRSGAAVDADFGKSIESRYGIRAAGA
jgi:uncharacterized LabA/DUF88 family protein